MRFIMLLLIALPLTTVYAETQQDRDPEFDRFLLKTVQDGELVYWRVEDLPVRVCEINNATGEIPRIEWHEALVNVLENFNEVVPTMLVTMDCHIYVNIVPEIPSNLCWRADGSQARACAEFSTSFSYPVNIWIAQDFYPMAGLLHELLHAYGVWVHVEGDYESAVHQRFNYLQYYLTSFDRQLLEYLYNRPAYTRAQQYDTQARIAEMDREYCAWVEANRAKLTPENYERYRCE